MADEAVPASEQGQDQGAEALKNFHRALTKRSQERDAALAENARLQAQIAELAALAPSEDEDEDDSETYEPPTPRRNGAPREFASRDTFDADTALARVFDR